MTDRQVLVFGSFTEDEIKSLLNGPLKNNDFTFGSLDSNTLKSVGIYDTSVSKLHSTKGCEFSKCGIQKNEFKIPSDRENSSRPEVSFSEENGCSSYTWIHDHASMEVKSCNTELAPSYSFDIANDSSNQSALIHSEFKSMIELSSSENVILDEPSNNVHNVEPEKSISKASDGEIVIPRNFLPRGLINSGNLCFLNATLQALLSCSSFFYFLHELRMRNIPEIGYPTLSSFIKFVSEFDVPANLICKNNEKTVLETARPFRPVMFEPVLKSFTPDISNNLSGRPRQEDAQEFLSFLMHQMHDELLKLDGQVSNGNGKTVSFMSSTDGESDDNWETVGPRNRTSITRTQSFMPSKLSDIFGGQLRSVVKARGSKASATIQPFLLLHLNICPDSVCTIEDALRLFSAPETLEGYRTSAAGKTDVATASKFVKILGLSEIMVLHLMRFSYGSQGSTKLHKAVHFPFELDIGRELLVSPSEDKRYELVATITHHGRDPSKGHYTADARHPDGKWLRYDDASVTPIRESKVLHDEAYVLFYKRM